MSSIPPIVTIALAAIAAPAFAQPAETPMVRGTGCDGIVGSTSGASTYGNATVNGQLLRSFAIGTYTWNIGNRPMEWVSTGANHPKLFQNIYRAKGKQFNHVALGWGKRGFAVGNGTISGFGPCVTQVTGGTMPSKLGISCSDLYGAGTNAGQSNLGPRFDVNPITGVFTPGSTAGSLVPAVSVANIDRRCVGLDSDFKPPASTDATYYAEAFVVTPDDAMWGNSRNNYSTRKLAAFPTLTSGSASQTINFATTPNYRATAIEHFAADTPGVSLTFTDFHERDNTFLDKYDSWETGETSIVLRPTPVTTTAHAFGRFITASSATDNGNGTWTYDYAIMNVNSHRSGGSVRFKLPAGAVVTDQSAFIPLYHSGDRFRNVPWNYDKNDARVQWTVDPTTEQRPLSATMVTYNPNALMFGAVHSYRFTVNKPPATGWFQLGLFRPTADAFGYQGSSLAITGAVVPSTCLADLGSQGAIAAPDSILDNNDFIIFINRYFAGDLASTDIGRPGGFPGPDNALDNNDFIVFVNAFFDGCL